MMLSGGPCFLLRLEVAGPTGQGVLDPADEDARNSYSLTALHSVQSTLTRLSLDVASESSLPKARPSGPDASVELARPGGMREASEQCVYIYIYVYIYTYK